MTTKNTNNTHIMYTPLWDLHTHDPQAAKFAEACCNDNTLVELRAASVVADETDCHNWDITPRQWRNAVDTAIAHLETVER
ncbi:hypothetical protein LCGC14_0375220 [marine sediment metagenome]|uniref:Uncharacterized protein n=1 Tax=marine sediment metagenome TaxID=412755 RepID=A0A0F9T411_9ZZZZ